MRNFSLGTQLERELKDFQSAKLRLPSRDDKSDLRYLRKNKGGYDFNQGQMIALVDLYYNSQFEDGPTDRYNRRKIFLNEGKFRTQVASKQVQIDTKEGKFIPADGADPFTAVFLQKDFIEWAQNFGLSLDKKTFGEHLNLAADLLPRYGSHVLKKVGRSVVHVPLQNLLNEQRAESLATSEYVIESHPEMAPWEMQEMTSWDLRGLDLKYDARFDVFERYGHVPLGWLETFHGEKVDAQSEDWNKTVYVEAIATKVPRSLKEKESYKVLFAEETDCPYMEVHWDRQHGRWLGIGVMEDLLENQRARNVVINVKRNRMHTSGKVILQSNTKDAIEQHLVHEIPDGSILEVGQGGKITKVDLAQTGDADFSDFMTAFDRNSDQKAFTYETATGENFSGTATVGVILSKAVQGYFGYKKQKLAIFFEKVVTQFMVDQFLRDMDNKDRVVSLFPDEGGYEYIRNATLKMVRTEAARLSLLSGKKVDANTLESATAQFADIGQMFFSLIKGSYKKAKTKFKFIMSEESIDVSGKAALLVQLYQALSANGDPRAALVLEKAMALQQIDVSSFNQTGRMLTPTSPSNAVPNSPPAPTVRTPVPVSRRPSPAQVA